MTRPQATQAQFLALTFPALPSVVRTCTPVLVGIGRMGGVVHAIEHGRAILTNCDNPVRLGVDSPMSVDLTDATGRAHLAWAIGATFGSSVGVWGRNHSVWGPTVMGWAIMLDDGSRRRFYVKDEPMLAGVNTRDDTRLPDGSLWVDAEALRLVGLHVLGGAA